MNPTIKEIPKELSSSILNIQHDGAVIVRGNTESGSFIEATDDIQIEGDVRDSRIKSIHGSVIVRGEIMGASTHIQAGKNIQATLVRESTLKAIENISVKKMATRAHLSARNSIIIDKEEGFIDGGEVQAGTDIIANSIGTQEKTDDTPDTTVKLVNYKQADLYSFMLKHGKEKEDLVSQVESLEKIIEIIRLLGKKVVMLPPEKKKELAIRIQKYNDLKIRISEIETEISRLSNENKNQEELDRTIIVKKFLFEGVKVAIDNVQLLIQRNFKSVILYKKGIIIIGDFDEFMKRKKFS